MTSNDILKECIQMDPYDFEDLVADIWRSYGYNCIVTSGSGDRGIDIVATKSAPVPEETIIQAKKYRQNNKIGSKQVREYATLRQQRGNADKIIIVTTSTFTQPAIELAESLSVDLVTGERLVEMIAETGVIHSEESRRYSTKDTADNASDRAADGSFPFFDYDRSQWRAPCPYCGSRVNNTQEAFVKHWTQSERCGGPNITPPAKLRQPNHSAWDGIVKTVESQTTNQQNHTDEDLPAPNEAQSKQVHSLDSDLDIQNYDGTYPWLRFPNRGWKVPCPYCNKKIFNNQDAFVNHWRDSEQCPVESQMVNKFTQ